MMLDRRTFVAAGATSLAFPSWAPGVTAQGASIPSFFADTPLAKNRVAAHFKPVDMKLPPIAVSTAQGSRTLSDVGGKVRLLSLWAEWCVPCLVEIRDFAKLRPQFANERFDIGLLMTATKLDRAQALARLRPLGAETMPLIIDNGARAAEELAVPPGASPVPGRKKPGFSLPCTLLVDARGRVRARAFGAPSASSMPRPELTEEQKAALKRGEPVVMKSRVLTDGDKEELLASGKTSWATPAGSEFLAALAGGLLDRM